MARSFPSSIEMRATETVATEYIIRMKLKRPRNGLGLSTVETNRARLVTMIATSAGLIPITI